MNGTQSEKEHFVISTNFIDYVNQRMTSILRPISQESITLYRLLLFLNRLLLAMNLFPSCFRLLQFE